MSELSIEDNETNQLWYDTKEGIQKSIKSLESFLQLLSERYAAVYERKEKLNEFLVLRYYYLDASGNCGKMTDEIIRNEFTELSNVLFMEDFWQYIEKWCSDPVINFVMGTGFPAEHTICPVCGKGWEINNCHDTIIRQKIDFVSLTDFVGQTLLEVKTSFAKETEAVYFMQTATLRRDDKSIKYPEIEELKEPWESNIVRNGNLLIEADGILNDYIVLDGDEGLFNISLCLHRECHCKLLAEGEG